MRADQLPPLDTPQDAVRFALETKTLAQRNFANCFPPWRWPKWRRQHKLTQRRLDHGWRESSRRMARKTVLLPEVRR